MSNIIIRRRYNYSLPYDAEVEYLESTTGDPYIDTGLKILNNVTGTIRLQIEGILNGYKSDATYRRAVLVSCYQKIKPYKGFRIGRISTNDGNNAYIQWNNGTRDLIEPYGTKFSLDVTHSLDNTAHDISLSFFVYWDNYYGHKWTAKGRLYHCKITINDIVVADFIPVRKDNVGYMFDKVRGKLFGNNGTGAFVIGPDITE